MLIDAPSELFANGNIRRVLLLRHDRIGDVLISSNFVMHLRNSIPEAQIDILLSFRNYSAKRSVERFADEILKFENKPLSTLKLIQKIRKKKYDLIIDLLDNESATSNLILKYSLAKYKLGFGKSNSNNYTHVVILPDKSKVHITSRLLNLLLPFGHGAGDDAAKPIFPLLDNEIMEAAELLGKKQKMRLGINLSGSSDAKYWGTKNYIEFINSVLDRYDWEVVLFATIKLQAKASEICTQTNAKIAPIQSNFNIYAAMISHCDCILTPDTAAVHIASALDIPVIALFQFTDEKYGMPWFPTGDQSKSIVSKENISAISVGVVINSFIELMGERL